MEYKQQTNISKNTVYVSCARFYFHLLLSVSSLLPQVSNLCVCISSNNIIHILSGIPASPSIYKSDEAGIFNQILKTMRA